MKFAIYTLTRDRLPYTQHCFETLAQKAGLPYDHYVIDNGSTDGTADWLTENRKKFKMVFLLRENIGISRASNIALAHINQTEYDIIIKMDNDCEVITDNILVEIEKIYTDAFSKGVKAALSPRVIGINNQPHRAYTAELANHTIGLTGIVGGLFHIVPQTIYSQYHYPENLPKAWGQDDDFCEWLRKNKYLKGYIEDLVVNHYETTDGQAARFPEYFERKWKEEKQ